MNNPAKEAAEQVAVGERWNNNDIAHAERLIREAYAPLVQKARELALVHKEKHFINDRWLFDECAECIAARALLALLPDEEQRT